MTANGLTTMYPGEKKNKASKTALLNLSFGRAVRLPFAIILLCDRVETNRIKPVSQGKATVKNPVFMRVYNLLTVIPTRSCQVCSKQFCLWDLALIIYIVSIIQMVWAV